MTDAKVRWQDVRQPRQAADCISALGALESRWYTHHSGGDGSEFTVEGLYRPHVEAGSAGVQVCNADLGRTCLTQIAGFVSVVTLPSMPVAPERTRSGPLQQPYFHHEWLRKADWIGFGADQSLWGEVGPCDKQSFVTAFRVAACPEGEPPVEVGALIRQELPLWWSRAAAWLELLSATHVRVVDDFHWSPGSTALYARNVDGQLESVPGVSRIATAPRLSTAWKTLSYWPQAIQLAGLGQKPPLACTLLVAAMRAFREGDYRVCVTESATAAEVALREALHRIGKQPTDRDTLGNLDSSARASIDGLVPAEFNRLMVRVRNRVVHDGALVDAETAAIAFELAQRVVHLVHPLPEVDSSGLTVA